MGGQIRGNKKENAMKVLNKEKTSMYLVMGITGKVGGATARHLLQQGKQVRALVRNRDKAAKWADQGVELVDGDRNDATAIAAALKGVEGAFVMLPVVWAPSPDLLQSAGRRGLHVFLRKVTWRASAADDDVGHSLDGLIQRKNVADLNRSSPPAIRLVEGNADVGEVLHQLSELRLLREIPRGVYALVHG